MIKEKEHVENGQADMTGPVTISLYVNMNKRKKINEIGVFEFLI